MSANLHPKVINLAANLLGIGAVPQQQEPAKTDSPIIQAVYPAITEDAFKQTMDNYRKHISEYNFKVREENELIRKFNSKVAHYLAENKDTLTEVQLKFRQSFYKTKLHLDNRDYNEAVETFCNEYGNIITKRCIPTVKYQTELIFQNMLHLYNRQLMKQNEQYMKLRVTQKRAIPEFVINSYLVTELRRNGIISIDVCTKTIRNHRMRLQEAGVFVDYHFAGSYRGVEVHINPSILVVFDIKKQKIKNAENQSFTPDGRKVLPDNNDSIRTIVNENQMKENVNNNSLVIRSSAIGLTGFSFSFTGTTAGKVQNPTEAAAEKNVKILDSSQKLRNQIELTEVLADQLAQKVYTNYKPIDIRDLYREAMYGTMTRHEFRELVLQDFFKSASRLWINSTAYYGSWLKAIQFYLRNKFINANGEVYHKQTICDQVSELRWRMEWARKWFIKNNFPPLFPYDYFDFTRKTAKEVGFEYTKEKYKQAMNNMAKYDALKKKQEKEAQIRKEQINHARKLDVELNRFFKNKITVTQLFEKVSKNFPAQYLDQLPQIIEQKTLEMNQKTVTVEGKDFIKYSFYEL